MTHGSLPPLSPKTQALLAGEREIVAQPAAVRRRALLRARAIEQQCYVLAAAQTGHHHGTRVSYGHAMIVDPWGTVLAQCGEGEGVAVATIDPEVVTRVRTALPSLANRMIR